MDYNGEIVFSITDLNSININLGSNFSPTKIINKGDMIALGKSACQNQWLYIVKFNGEEEYLKELEKLTNQLNEEENYVKQILAKYDKASIDIYIRSDFAEIGYPFPSHIIKKLASLECDINFEIFSFGMAVNKN